MYRKSEKRKQQNKINKNKKTNHRHAIRQHTNMILQYIRIISHFIAIQQLAYRAETTTCFRVTFQISVEKEEEGWGRRTNRTTFTLKMPR